MARSNGFEVSALIEFWSLLIAGKSVGITIWPDGEMWRVHCGDEHLPEAFDLARAREAAIDFARGKGLGGSGIVRWNRRESRADATAVRTASTPGGIDPRQMREG